MYIERLNLKNEKVQILFLSHTFKLHFLSISLGRTWIRKVWKLENNVWVEFYHWAVHSESCRPKRTDNYRNGKKKKKSYLHISIKLFTS